MKTLMPLCAVAVLSLAACGEDVNPPTEPAEPVTPPPSEAPTPEPGQPAPMPASFVGLWAADLAWCSNTPATGDRVPIRITPTRFEGYENRCDILEVRESGGVYDTDMRCTAEGTTSDQTIRMLVQGDAMDLTYVSAGGGKVQLNRCADPQVTVDQPGG